MNEWMFSFCFNKGVCWRWTITAPGQFLRGFCISKSFFQSAFQNTPAVVCSIQGEQLRWLLQLQVLCAVSCLRLHLLCSDLCHCCAVLHQILDSKWGKKNPLFVVLQPPAKVQSLSLVCAAALPRQPLWPRAVIKYRMNILRWKITVRLLFLETWRGKKKKRFSRVSQGLCRIKLLNYQFGV